MNHEPLVEQNPISRRQNDRTIFLIISISGIAIIVGMPTWSIVFYVKISQSESISGCEIPGDTVNAGNMEENITVK